MPTLSLPSPTSVPAAMSKASPGPGVPNPMIVTHTNKTTYSAAVMAAAPG